VSIYDASASGALARVTAAGDGSFEFRVPPGDYRVSAGQPGEPFQWHPSGFTVASAATVPVGVDETVTADVSIVPASSLETISGSVGDGSGPVAGVRAMVYASGGGVVAVATTDAAGSYQVQGLQPGDYRVKFFDPAGGHVTEWFNDEPRWADSDAVTVLAGSGATANAFLAAAGQVAGVVTDGGAPVAGARVRVYPAAGTGTIAAATTAADGSYTITLPVGTYRIRVVPDGPRPGQWWNQASGVGDADPLAIAPEATTPADFPLPG
jgi:hypothetical protein